MSIKKLIKSSEPLVMKATLRVFTGKDKFFGPGKLELLEHIQSTGSISQAAKKMGMSYKKAWDMINALNQQCTKPIVITQTGGSAGGKAVVTPEGEQLIQAFQVLNADFQSFLDAQSARFLEL